MNGPIQAALLGLSMLAAGCYALSDFEGLEDGTLASTTGTAGSGGGGGVGGEGNGAGGQPGAGGNGGEGGTGGAVMCPPLGVDYSGLRLNEIAAKGVPEDWMELVNMGETTLPLCAVFVTQEYDGITPPTGGDRYTFGPVNIGAGQYLIIHSPSDYPFNLEKDIPERVTLFAPDGTVLDDTETVTDMVDPFSPANSWARIPDGEGSFQRVSSPTKGSENIDFIGTGGAGGSGGN